MTVDGDVDLPGPTRPSRDQGLDVPADEPQAAVAAQRGWLLVMGGVGCVLFAILTTAIAATGGVNPVDTTISHLAVSVRAPTVTTVAATLTRLGSFPVVVTITALAAGLLRTLTHRWNSSALLVISVALTAGVVYLTKIAVGRARPDVGSLVGMPSMDSAFPSGHTTDGSVALVLTAFLVAAALRPPALRRALHVSGILLAFVIGLTRVYLGYHWATDVIGGWLLASAVVYAAVYLEVAMRPAELPVAGIEKRLDPGQIEPRPRAGR